MTTIAADIDLTTAVDPAAPPGTRPVAHPPARSGRVGVLLMSLGTPEGTGYWPMRRYLKEFLSDRRVIEVSRLIWWPVLNLVILTKRPGPKGRDYASVWNTERDEGPLKTITRAQAEDVAEHLAGTVGDKVVVDWSMRYGFPRTADRIQALLDQGCDRILAVPLYPQYAAATSATACDQVFAALQAMRWQPAIRIAPPWHDDPVYIDALVLKMKADLAKLDFEPEIILVSFHGVPKEYLLKGDPYHCHCVGTYRLGRVAEALHGRDRDGAREVRRQEHGDRGARLHGRLPGDAGGARRREPPLFRGQRRRALRLPALPQRDAGRHAGHPARGRAGAVRLDLIAAACQAAALMVFRLWMRPEKRSPWTRT